MFLLQPEGLIDDLIDGLEISLSGGRLAQTHVRERPNKKRAAHEIPFLIAGPQSSDFAFAQTCLIPKLQMSCG
jgi:hypothetical protein